MNAKYSNIILVIIVIIIGAYAIYLSGMHGYYEVLLGNNNPNGVFFDAITGNLLSKQFSGWPGWPAFSIIPNFLITGLLVFTIDGLFLIWLVFFHNNQRWGAVIILFSILLCIFGGGFKPPFFGIVSGVISKIGNKIIINKSKS